MMSILLKALLLAAAAKPSASSIDGIRYMDPLKQRPAPGSDPCNPLYWYPQHIPDYCYLPKPIMAPAPPPPIPIPAPVPVPVPVPVPLPPPAAVGLPVPIPLPGPPPVPLPAPMPFPMSAPLAPPMPPMPLPYGMPPNVPPYPHYAAPYPPYAPSYSPSPHSNQIGMVPGIPELVSPDGGINILPFSDAYSNALENMKSKMIRRRYERILEDYEDFPRIRKSRKYRRHRKKFRKWNLSLEE